jgi:glyoxylase-like metal-dependent hydrolase (beta-lactamase superfamily II)
VIEIHRLHLADVTPAPNLPWARPTYPVFAFLVLHPAGPILVDTGIGTGNALIEELYTPVHHDLEDARGTHGVGVDDVRTVITSHLHFDHCGQNDTFAGSTILVQQAEADAARAPLYTVPEWAFPPGVDLTLIDGDHDVAAGVRIIATPGHTPGHQSVLVVDDDGTRSIVCCQATWDASSFRAASLGDDGWDQAAGTASLERLHALEPDRVLVSHDADEWRRDRPDPEH